MPRKKPDTEKRKAPNGAGSMTYIESKQLYCFRISVNGKRLPFYDKSEKIARQKGIAAQARALAGETPVNKSMKIKDWALQWLEDYKSALSARTIQGYKDVIKAQIVPRIGNYSFKSIKPAQISKMLGDLAKEGKSKSLVSRVRLLVNEMLEDAVDNELLIKNPCRKIKLPPMEGSKEKTPFTGAEEKAIIDFVPQYLNLHKPHEPRRVGRMVVILIKTGMRQEELLALRWEDIDFSDGIIHIRRALDIDPNDPTKAPKSAASARDIPLHEMVKKEFEALGPQNEGYIFQTKAGGLLETHNFRRDYRKFLEAAGVEYRSPHITRHTFASDLRAAGVDAKTISRLLGHSRVNISLDVYIHSDEDAARDAIKKI